MSTGDFHITICDNQDSVLDILNKERAFNGRKVCHPFNRITVVEEILWTQKKKGKEIQRKKLVKGQVYADTFESEDIGKLIKNALRFELKHDGGCGFCLYDEEAVQFNLHARIDVKIDPKTGTWKDIGKDWIQCETEPVIPEGEEKKKYHWPHFRPCSEDPKGYKWFIEAFDKLKSTGLLEKLNHSFTFELMGNKSNRCESDPIDANAVIIPHGLVQVEVPVEMRTYDGFRTLFETFDKIEGVVAYCENGEVFKIRRDMFQDVEGKRMKWPNGPSDGVGVSATVYQLIESFSQ